MSNGAYVGTHRLVIFGLVLTEGNLAFVALVGYGVLPSSAAGTLAAALGVLSKSLQKEAIDFDNLSALRRSVVKARYRCCRSPLGESVLSANFQGLPKSPRSVLSTCWMHGMPRPVRLRHRARQRRVDRLDHRPARQRSRHRHEQRVAPRLASFSDQVLPFNITLAGANDYGAITAAKILDVEVPNEGSGFSVDDSVTESQATFVARAIESSWAVISP